MSTDEYMNMTPDEQRIWERGRVHALDDIWLCIRIMQNQFSGESKEAFENARGRAIRLIEGAGGGDPGFRVFLTDAQPLWIHDALIKAKEAVLRAFPDEDGAQ